MPPPPPPGSTGSTPKHPSGNTLPSTGSTPGKHPDQSSGNAILPPGLKQMLFRALPVVTMTFLSWVLMNWTSSAAASYRFVCFGFASLCALTYFARWVCICVLDCVCVCIGFALASVCSRVWWRGCVCVCECVCVCRNGWTCDLIWRSE
jgi:hypothetical protein